MYEGVGHGARTSGPWGLQNAGHRAGEKIGAGDRVSEQGGGGAGAGGGDFADGGAKLAERPGISAREVRTVDACAARIVATAENHIQLVAVIVCTVYHTSPGRNGCAMSRYC